MFARTVHVQHVGVSGKPAPCPVAWLDNFAMRNFTNDPIFDDTLPISDGMLEIGNRVPLDRLQSSMEDWFRRKSYLKPGNSLQILEQDTAAAG